MRAGELPHGAGILARGSLQEFEEGAGFETGKNGGSISAIRHCCPSGVVIRTPRPRTLTVASAASGFGVPRLKRPTTGYCALGENLSGRELGAGAVRLEHAGEADALGVVAAVAERRAGRRGEGVDQSIRREAPGREPSGGIGEGRGGERDDRGDQDERSEEGTGGRSEGLGQTESPSNDLCPTPATLSQMPHGSTGGARLRRPLTPRSISTESLREDGPSQGPLIADDSRQN